MYGNFSQDTLRPTSSLKRMCTIDNHGHVNMDNHVVSSSHAPFRLGVKHVVGRLARDHPLATSCGHEDRDEKNEKQNHKNRNERDPDEAKGHRFIG